MMPDFSKAVRMEFEVEDSVLVGTKTVPLNLNNYRNAHHQTLNKAKVNFKNNLYAQHPELLTTVRASAVRVSYEIRPRDKRMFDTMNVISIVDKFFMDALVEAGVIPDDNYTVAFLGDIITADPDLSHKTDKKKKIVIFCDFLLL
jgi:hypothetical protein